MAVDKTGASAFVKPVKSSAASAIATYLYLAGVISIL